MMKRLAIIMLAISAYRMPADAASLSIFAYDGAARPVLQSDPATVSAFNADDHAQTKTANFVYYTLEVPADWTQAGTGKMQPADKTLLVTALNLTGIEASTAPEQDAAAMKSLLAELEKTAIRTLTSQGCKVVQEFSSQEIDRQRSLIRGVFQTGDGMTVVQYYVEGPTYVVPVLVTGNRDGTATMAEMDPILSSLKWLGKPLQRQPAAH